MAFLVCYSGSLEDHARNKAIYLDQAFYELIFARCRLERSGYVVLREIASPRYKSPTLIVGQERLRLLADELSMLCATGVSHTQLAEFSRVCAQAEANGCSLTVSGDMYPEL
jgi:hypothetical protein